MERKTTTYTITSTRVSRTVTFAVAADLHNGPYEDVLDTFRQVDAVLVPGDLLNRHRLGAGQPLSGGSAPHLPGFLFSGQS